MLLEKLFLTVIIVTASLAAPIGSNAAVKGGAPALAVQDGPMISNGAAVSIASTYAPTYVANDGSSSHNMAIMQSSGGMNFKRGIPREINSPIPGTDRRPVEAAPPSHKSMDSTSNSAYSAPPPSSNEPNLVNNMAFSGVSTGYTSFAKRNRIERRLDLFASLKKSSHRRVNFKTWMKMYGIEKPKVRCKSLALAKGYKCFASTRVAGEDGKGYSTVEVTVNTSKTKVKVVSKDQAKDQAKYKAEQELEKVLEKDRDDGTLIAVSA